MCGSVAGVADLDDELQDALDDLAVEGFYLGAHSEPAFTIPDDCPVCLHEWRCVCPSS